MSNNINFLKKFIFVLTRNKKENIFNIKDENETITLILDDVSASRKYNPNLKNSKSCNIGLCKSEIISKIIKKYDNISIEIEDVNNTITLVFQVKDSGFKISKSRKYNPKLKKSRAYNIGLCESAIISEIIEMCLIDMSSDINITHSFINEVKYILFDKVLPAELISSSAYSGLNDLLNNNIFNEKQKSKIINIIMVVAKNIDKREDVFISSSFKKYILSEAKIFKDRKAAQIQFTKNDSIQIGGKKSILNDIQDTA